MTRALAVARLELGEMWRLLPLPGVIGCFPLLALLLPDVTPTMRAPIAIGLLALATVAIAPFVGFSLFSRELAERRLSFYFARPLSGLQVVAGKLLGGGIVIIVCQVLLLVPTAVVDLGVMDQISRAPAFLAMTGLLFGFGAALGIALRSRSRLLLADALLLTGLGLLAALCWHWADLARLVGALSPSVLTIGSLAAPAGLAATFLFLSVAVGISRGRADPARVHGAMSSILWPSLYLMICLLLLLVAAAFRSDPQSLAGATHVASGAGHWIAIEGREPRDGRRAFHPIFLMDLRSRQLVQLAPSPRGGRVSVLGMSLDGNQVAWAEVLPPVLLAARRAERSSELVWTDTRRLGGLRRLHLGAPGHLRDIVLSPDGTRAAITSSDRSWTTFDLSTGMLLSEVQLPAPDEFEVRATARFLSPSRLLVARMLRSQPSGERVEHWAIEVQDGRFRALAARSAQAFDFVAVSPMADRMVVAERGGETAEMFDLSTGRPIGLVGAGTSFSARFTADGRLLILRPGERGVVLTLYAPDGNPVREIRFGQGEGPPVFADAVSQPDLDHILVHVRRGITTRGTGEVYLVDLAKGSARLAATGLSPPRRSGGPQDPLAPPGPGARLFEEMSIQGPTIVELDLETGRVSRLVGQR